MEEHGGSRSSSSSGIVWPSFPMGEQPDVVLSMDRDSYYSGTLLGEGLKDVLESSIGVRRTGLVAPEVKLLAAGLYFGLTVVSGKQTLGQEYCDLLLARRGLYSVPLPARGAYSLVEICWPYLMHRLSVGWPSLSEVRNPFNRHAEAARIRDAMRAHAHAAPQRTEPAAASEQSSHPASISVSVTRSQRWLKYLAAHRNTMASVMRWATALHLMIFFFNGRYYTVAMRALRMRLQYNRAQTEPHARYTILGIFMLAQAALQGAMMARERMQAMKAQSASATAAATSSAKDTCSSRVPSYATSNGTHDTSASQPVESSYHKCALCMSAREHTAATPCGHLFCWQCIVEWCEGTPECPLCRQSVEPQGIVCLYQYE